MPTDIIAPKKKKSLANKEIGWVSQKDLLLFTQHLSIMLGTGSTLSEALRVLQKHRKGKLKEVIENVAYQVNQGKKFSEALSHHPHTFSTLYRNTVSVGERSGKLQENLEYLGNQLEKREELKKKVIGASIYPAIVFFGGILLAIGITVFALPQVSQLFSNFNVELPWSTRTLLKVADLIEVHGKLIAILCAILIPLLTIILRLKRMRPITHWIFLHIPVVNRIIRHFNLAMIGRTLGLLLHSGVTIDESVKICVGSIKNHQYRTLLGKAYTGIKGGESLSHILEAYPKFFPPTDVQIIHVGERSGTLTQSLNHCAVLHEKEVDDLSRNMSSLLEPFLLIFIGVLVGFLALSIIRPLYSITNQLQI